MDVRVVDASEGGSDMLHEVTNGQSRVGASETISLAQKLQALTDENSNLERRLQALVMNNRALQSMRSRKLSFKF
jgi:hypothetical protein